MTVPPEAARAYREVRKSPWTARMVRFGLIAKGSVYLLVGAIAIQFARGERAHAANSRRALVSLADEQLGWLLLGALAAGLFGYAAWCAVQAISDPDGHGSGFRGVAVRAGKAMKAIAYGGTAVFAGSLALGSRARAGRESAWSACVFDLPLGDVLLCLTGLVLAGIGIYQIWAGATTRFLNELNGSRMGRVERAFVLALGRFGHVARGIVFLVIGWRVLHAAIRSNPGEVRGLGGAIDALAKHEALLGFVAAGLAAYGLFHWVAARHWRVAV